jgi:FixJ family two-component response regulator
LAIKERQNILPPRKPKCRMKIEIAAELGLIARTVEDRRAKLMKKMDDKSLAELVQQATMH